jgi:hypothetical protein
MRRGSALLMALWVIAVLSVMVLSFATEARYQGGINLYVRERNRVNRLIESGRILGEVVLSGYQEVADWTDGENHEDLFEEDRWYREKRSLKTNSDCTIGPILLDEENPESGTVTVEITEVNAGASNGINVNELYSGGDKNYALRWQMILRSCGVPEEARTEKEGTINLWNRLVASWNDWRDEDDTVSRGPLENGTDEDGAESSWYEEEDEEDDVDDEDRRRPRNGSIPNVQELAYVRTFRDFPAVLTGGLLYPDEAESPDNPRISGLVKILGISGTSKVNVNKCSVEQLMTIPGIFDEEEAEDDGDMEKSREVAQAIIDTLKIEPDYDVDETQGWWPYKDWQDLRDRVENEFDVEIGQEASEYLSFAPEANSVFRMKITGESMGMKREVNCECYVKDKKVRYIKWQED